MIKFHIKLLFAAFTIFLASTATSQIPHPSFGTIKHFPDFPSKYVQARNVDVWLPDDYSPKKKYAVIYMHDGQSLFDSTITWNKQEWQVDETMQKFKKNHQIRDCIVVGIWNIPAQRFADYFPQKIINNIPEPEKGAILSKQIGGEPHADNYLKFIVNELKPFVDRNFPTKKDTGNTFVMGSSMGGLISLYALCEYPQIFGGAACLSTHLPLSAPGIIGENNDKNVAAKFRDYLMKNLPKANSKKIYFDYGDKALDSLYKPYQLQVDNLMRKKGWEKPYWETLYFPGASHTETAWAKRLDAPILFLLKK